MATTKTYLVLSTILRNGEWVDGPEIGTVEACGPKTARRQIERELGYAVGTITEVDPREFRFR